MSYSRRDNYQRLGARTREAGRDESRTADAAAHCHTEYVCGRRYPECKPVERRMAIVGTARVFAVEIIVDAIDPNIACKTK